MMKSKLQNQFGLNKYYQLPQKCLSCNFLFACRGGCPKNRIIQTDEYGKRLNYLCRDYHKFFSHVTPYMNFMKNELTKERPPANVMKWARKNQAII